MNNFERSVNTEIGSTEEREGENVYAPELWEHRGRTIDFIGVSHVPETLKLHEKELQDAMAGAEAVLLEAAPHGEGVFSDTFPDAISREFGEVAITAELAEEIAKYTRNHYAIQFFAQVEDMAAEMGKRTLVFDPHRTGNELNELPVSRMDRRVSEAKSAIVGGSMGLLIALEGWERFRKPNNAASGRVSRRSFLKAGLAAAAGLATISAASHAREELALRKLPEEKKRFDFRGRTGNPMGSALYDFMDYRDVVIAEGMDHWAKKGEGGTPLVAIYGVAHREPVQHYLKSPAERAAKLALYAPYKNVAPPLSSEYVFENGVWRKDHEEAL